MPTISVTLLTRPGCHLCDDARVIVAKALAEVAADSTVDQVVFTEQSILDDAVLLEQYADEIPVVMINGQVHNYWRIDPIKLTAALRAL